MGHVNQCLTAIFYNSIEPHVQTSLICFTVENKQRGFSMSSNPYFDWMTLFASGRAFY